MFDERDRKWLYEQMQQAGVNTGTYDDFKASLNDDTDRAWYYDKSIELGLNVGNSDEFTQMMTEPQTQQPTATTQPTAQQPTQRNMGTPGYVPNRFGLPTQQQPVTPATTQYVTQQGQGETYTPSARVQTPTAKRPKPMAPKPVSGDWNGESLTKVPYAPTTEEDKVVSFMPLEQGEDTRQAYAGRKQAKRDLWQQQSDNVDSLLAASEKRDMEAGTKRTIFTDYGSEEVVTPKRSNETRELRAAQRALRNTQRIINAADNEAGFGQGLKERVFDIDNWDFGITDMADLNALKRAMDAFDKGEKLTESQQALLDAKALEMAVNVYFSSDLSKGYQAGQDIAGSLPFMAEFMLGIGSAASKATSKALVKYFTKRFAKAMENKAVNTAVKAGARVLSDLERATIMTGTTGVVGTEADARQRMMGQVRYDEDEQGKVTYAGHTQGEDEWKARRKAATARTLTNFSEMFGEYLGFLGKGGRWLSGTKGGKFFGLDKVAGFIDNVASSEIGSFIGRIESKAQFHGAVGEMAEELFDGVTNATFVGDQTLQDVFGKENLTRTALSVGIMSMFFSGAKLGGYGVAKGFNAADMAVRTRRADRAASNAFGTQWDGVKGQLDGATAEQAADIIQGMYESGNYTDEQLQSALNYAIFKKGNEMIERYKANNQTMQEAAAEQSYNTGYDDANTDELRSDINMAYTDARARLVEMIGEDAVNEIDSDPLAMQAQYDQDMTVDDNTKFAIADYVSAKSAWDGVQQRISDDAADRADQRRAEGERMAYKGNGDMQGMLRPLTIKEKSSEIDPQTGEKKNKVVYLVNGNIAIEPNGNGLSREGTDKTIYVYDPETGDTHELDPFAGAGVLEVGEPVSMEDYLANNEQQSQAEVQQEIDNATGKVNVQPNTPFVTPEGRQGIVKSVEGDNVIVQFADGEMEEASIPLADMQQYADALRRQEYEARHPQQTATEQPQQPNTATEGQTPTAEAETPTEGGNTVEDTRTPAQRTYDDVVAKLGAERASKKIDATAKVKADRLKKAEKALKTAQETADNTEYGSKEEQKAEEAVVKAQAEYEAAQQDMAAWDEVRKLRDQALLAQAEQEEQQRKAELERKRAAETEAQRKQREAYEAEQARRKAEAEAAEKRRQEENERLKQQASNPQPAEQPAPIDGTKGQASQLAIARQKLEGDPEALAMLDETTPRTLVEVAATLLASGKNATKLLREDFKRETGYSDADVKRYPFLFAGADKGGITLARFGEMVVEAAREYGVQFDENDATAGIGAALELLGSVSSQADINNYITNSRIAEAYDYHNAALAAARARMLEAYGMTEEEYESYMSWLEDAIEQGKSTLSDEEFNQIFNIYGQEQTTDVESSDQQGAETAERTESAETDVSQNGERGNGETDAGTGEQPTSGEVATAIAAAEAETDTNPTEGQKEAGNYKKGHVRIDGYDITIEQPKGSVRRGIDKNGRAWEQEMHNTYGYIRGTESVDGDHIDVYLSDDPTQGNVYVVDQVNEDGTFDEHKVMYGFPDMESARQAYLSNYEDGWRGLGTITPVSKEEFKKWIESSHRKTKPFSEYKRVKTEGDVMVGEGIKPAAEQSEGTAEGEQRDYNKPLKSLAEVKRFMEEIGYNGSLSKTMTTEDGRKFVKYYASGNVSPNIYFGETTPRDILQQFYLYNNIMEVYIPADIWAEFEQEDAERKESRDNYWANEREKAKDILTQANIPFVDVIDSERGIRVVFTDKKNDYGNYVDYMDLSDTEQLQEDIEDVREKAESYKQPKQEPKAETWEEHVNKAMEAFDKEYAAIEKSDGERLRKEAAGYSDERLLNTYIRNAGISQIFGKGREGMRKFVGEEKNFKAEKLDDVKENNLEAAPDAARQSFVQDVLRAELDRRGIEYKEDYTFAETSDAEDWYKKNVEGKTEQPRAAVGERENKEPEKGGKVEKVKNEAAPKEKIDDVGEKIGGARKDLAQKMGARINLDADTFPKMFPKFDLKKAVEQGLDPKLASSVYFLRIAAQKEYKSWLKRSTKGKALSAAKFFAAYAKQFLENGNTSTDFKDNRWTFTEYGKKHIECNLLLFEKIYEKFGNAMFDLDLAGYEINPIERLKGIKYFRKNEKGNSEEYQPAYEAVAGYSVIRYEEGELDKAIDEVVKRMAESVSYKESHPYKLSHYYMPGEANSHYIGVKLGGKVVALTEKMSDKEASQYLREHEAELQEKAKRLDEERKQSKQGGTNTKWKPELGLGGGRARVGNDYRNGKDVSADEFRKTFGFRGVEFGNYVTQAERQRFINEAYDAMMDMAALLNVSPRALSLGGRLGFAIGARGGGNAMAHYEPDLNVINLTKSKGAGSLAHEWWHALDYYFNRMGDRRKTPATANRRAEDFNPGQRREMEDAFVSLMEKINSSDYRKRSVALDAALSKDYYTNPTELGARAFQDYVQRRLTDRGQINDFLSSFTPEEQWNGKAETYPYPTGKDADVIDERFDSLFGTMLEREDEQGNVMLYERVDGKAAKVSAKERKLRDAVVDLLRKAGIDVVTESEEGQRVMDMANGRERQHRVYHGSGADFERFDHSHMGEGEGAQSFGWGTYVTEVEGIGRQYAENLPKVWFRDTESGYEVDWEEVRDNWEEGAKRSALLRVFENARGTDYNMEDAIENAISEIEGREGYEEELAFLRQLTADNFEIDRILYTVEIPEDNGSNYIDWTKKPGIRAIRRFVAQMNDKQKERIASIPVRRNHDGEEFISKDNIAERILWHINNSGWNNLYDVAEIANGGKYVGNEKSIAKLLNAAGFVGIKYPAEYYSGGRSDGAKNYVIFDEGDLQITDKVKFFRTENGEAYGFTMDGKIYLDPKIATAETPIHEYTHLWAAALRAANPKAWERLKSELEKDKDLMAYVQRLYPELKGDELMDEVFAHFSGRRGAERLRAEQERMEGETRSIVGKAKVIAMFENLRNALKKFWNAARELFGGKSEKNESAEDFADMVLGDLLSGFNPTENKKGKRSHIDPRSSVPNVRGGWNERKIKDYLKHNSTRSGVFTAARAISEFDNVDDLKEHMFYHGTVYGSDKLKPSITMSEREAERYGGGGYGDRYWGISLTKSKKVASAFSGSSSSVRIYPVILLKDAKVIERHDFEDAADLEEHIVELWNEGVDAVWIGEGKQGKGEQELCVLNPRAVVNIGTPDFYKVYQLGTKENPLRIADDAAIEKMYKTAKEYVSFPAPRKPFKPLTPDRYDYKDGEVVRISDEEYAQRVAEYEDALEKYNNDIEEYNNSEALRMYENIREKAKRYIRYQKADSDVRFRGEEEPVFYSNAMRAVENIKQERATPEQWVKMIEKQGGMKAGEDKWLGLSEWLKGSDAKTLTKGEMLDYIRANEIQVEEVEYSDARMPDDFAYNLRRELEEKASEICYDVTDEYEDEIAGVEDFSDELDEIEDETINEARRRLDEEFGVSTEHYISIQFDTDRRRLVYEPTGSDRDFSNNFAQKVWNQRNENEDEPINETRLLYTTRGLNNKREIVLTVPTIEPWNEHDEVHFGEAGGGRAVAWVRFGETTDADGKRVLVIDEIQSNRHQEGREKGYKPANTNEKMTLFLEKLKYERELEEKYGTYNVNALPSVGATTEEVAKLQRFNDALKGKGIPDAPFEKNWHEVAMKRMLRFAAENGYDKVAWTKGEQQARRYDLGQVIDKIVFKKETGAPFGEPDRIFYPMKCYKDGELVKEFSPAEENLEELVGRDIANEMKASGFDGENTIEKDLITGNVSGMQGFYDQMLPRFMDKYGKRWGVKTGEVELPNIGDNGLTMWSVDVTDDMRESVMRGQPLFRPKTQSREGGEEANAGEWYDRGSVERIGEFVGYSPKRIAAMNARQEQTARNKFRDAAEKLHLSDNITFADTIDDVPGLTDKQRREWRRKKGWYSPRTGKIVIILGNHKSMDDVMKSILHEGVAHHGLRQLFGEHFNTFLDNVYRAASPEIRERIYAMAKKHGWDFRTATEEYLAMLAEDTDFERPENQSWWKQVKAWFIDMLHKIGFRLHDAYDTITDNELRYILWRSYQNLVNPGRFNSVVEEAKDIAKQYELKVGQWDETWTVAAEAEPNATIEFNGRRVPIWATNGRRENRADRGSRTNRLSLADFEKNMRAYPLSKYDYREDGESVIHNNAYWRAVHYLESEKVTLADAKSIANMVDDEILTSTDSVRLEELQGMYDALMPWIEHREEEEREMATTTEQRPTKRNIADKKYAEFVAQIRKENPNIIILKHDGDYYSIEGEDAKRAAKILGSTLVNNNGTSLIGFPAYKIDEYLPKLVKAGVKVAIADNVAADGVAEDGVRFRDGEEEETGAPKPQARGAYERMVSSAASQWKEAMQDSMLSLKKLYQAVSQAYKGSTKDGYRIEDEKGYENAYLAENRMHSMSEAQIHAYQQDYMKPLQRAIHALTDGKREAYETLTDYMMAKHGLERNEVMAKRDAKKAWEEQNKSEIGNPNYTATKNAVFANIDAGVDDLYLEYRKQDYAGLTALTGIEDVEEAEKEAQRMVDEYEQQHDTTDLWIATNRATRRSLFKMLESGLLSPERHAEIRDMYQYYIPLQGFDSDVAEDVYAYMGSDGTRLYGTTIRAAKGRKSKADDPIATIAMNGEAAIRRGNRNLMKQHFLRFVQSHPSDLVSINDVWLRKNANGEWEQYFDADLKETDTPEEVARKVRDFNERMEQEAAANPDLYKRSRDLPNVPFRVLNVRDMEQHQVMVQVDGKNYLLTINGNPRAAQALNGLTNPDVFTEGAFGSIMNATQSVVRTLSQFYTTRNPNFVLSNFLRDAVYTNSMVLAKESPNYALNFHKNFLLLPNERMGVLFASWENGKLREKLANGTASNMEKMFYDFMMNGGETGWTSLRDIEKHKRDLQKALKREGNIAASALNKLGDFFDITNRMIENHARFTAYVTSIEMGRSVERAVWDAKEISVNFNKKGAGDKFLKAKNQTFVGKVGAFVSGLGRGNYAFWNASLQGLNNIARIGKRNPAKFMAVATTLMGLGVAIPLLNALLGGDDDDDKNAYWNLPEYVRRSNICFRFTKDMPWITIPLPIEFRAIYGLGELGSGVALGKEYYSKGELTKQVAAQFSQVLPLDFMEGGGGWHCLYPTYIKPVIEAYSNQSWTGLPIYRKNTYGQYDVAPEWQRAYSNTNNQIMAATKWLNEATGGDEVQGGNIDFNPARIEYMLRGYLGGYFTVADQVIKMGETATGNREFEWRNMMLANRVVKEGDERTEARKLTNEYFNLKEEYDKTDKSLKAYKKKQDEGTLSVVGQAHYIALMNDSEEYGRYLVFGTYKPLFDAYYKQIKEANAAGDSEEAKRLERGQNELRREMVNIIHDMDNGGTFDRKKVATGINENLKKMQNDKLWDAQDKAINKSIEADNALNPTDNVEE